MENSLDKSKVIINQEDSWLDILCKIHTYYKKENHSTNYFKKTFDNEGDLSYFTDIIANLFNHIDSNKESFAHYLSQNCNNSNHTLLYHFSLDFIATVITKTPSQIILNQNKLGNDIFNDLLNINDVGIDNYVKKLLEKHNDRNLEQTNNYGETLLIKALKAQKPNLVSFLSTKPNMVFDEDILVNLSNIYVANKHDDKFKIFYETYKKYYDNTALLYHVLENMIISDDSLKRTANSWISLMGYAMQKNEPFFFEPSTIDILLDKMKAAQKDYTHDCKSQGNTDLFPDIKTYLEKIKNNYNFFSLNTFESTKERVAFATGLVKLDTMEKVEKWLNLHGIKNYTIHDDLTVDVEDNVDLSMSSLHSLPIQFGLVKGKFDCSMNYLTSLKGSPTMVGDINDKFKAHFRFNCSYNQLTSLEYSPQIITGAYDCSNNDLKNLHHATQNCAHFYCSNNQLVSLEGAPQQIGQFICAYNNLTSLEFGPQKVEYLYDCSFNQLTSLKHIPLKITGSLRCSNNNLLNLEHAPKKITEDFVLFDNPKLKDIPLSTVGKEVYFNHPYLVNLLKDEINCGKIKHKTYNNGLSYYHANFDKDESLKEFIEKSRLEKMIPIKKTRKAIKL